MPELPEVETIRLQLDKVLKGLVIEDIEVLRSKSFMGESPVNSVSGIDWVKGRRVTGVRRRAKITFIELENVVSLAIHLKMTGQLLFRSTTGITSTKGTTSITGKRKIDTAILRY